jgi:hypothetical protein
MYKKYTEPRKLERKIVYDIHNFLGPCECVRPQNIRKMCIYRSVLMEEGGARGLLHVFAALSKLEK